jgi:hypothetical protein
MRGLHLSQAVKQIGIDEDHFRGVGGESGENGRDCFSGSGNGETGGGVPWAAGSSIRAVSELKQAKIFG